MGGGGQGYFQKKHIESWPYVLIVIDCQDNEHTIAVSRNDKAFYSSKKAFGVLLELMYHQLNAVNLSVHFEALYTSQFFWEIEKRYHGKIKKIKV